MVILNQQKIPNILEQFQKMYQNVSVCHKSQFGEIFSSVFLVYFVSSLVFVLCSVCHV